jgi:ubiquinol-cytochrome c reductase cytochrome b subunit
MNSAGIGAFFNLTNFGQMYSYHVLVLPAFVILLVVVHILMVRNRGVVPPFELEKRAESPTSAGGSPPQPVEARR